MEKPNELPLGCRNVLPKTNVLLSCFGSIFVFFFLGAIPHEAEVYSAGSGIRFLLGSFCPDYRSPPSNRSPGKKVWIIVLPQAIVLLGHKKWLVDIRYGWWKKSCTTKPPETFKKPFLKSNTFKLWGWLSGLVVQDFVHLVMRMLVLLNGFSDLN